MARVSAVLTLVAAAFGACASAPEEPAWWHGDWGADQVAAVRRLSDEDLWSAFDYFNTVRSHLYSKPLDGCLAEMVRRGGKKWERSLERTLHREVQKRPVERHDLVILTALRRLRGAGDPMVVQVENDSELESVFPEVPILRVRLRNVGDRAFVVTVGSTYPSDWHLEVRDAEGHLLPPNWGHIGGGLKLIRVSVLHPGVSVGILEETLAEVRGTAGVPWMLCTGHYVDLPGPGEYRVTVHYHDRLVIREDDLDACLAARSDPVVVRWKPRIVHLTAERKTRIQALVRRLCEESRVAIFDRPWLPEMEFEGKAGSVAEEIYRLGYDALPVLLEQLDDQPEIRHRAHILAMLANLTGYGHCDTYFGRALGAWVRYEGHESNGKVRFRLEDSGNDDGPTAKGQRWMLETWKRCRRMVRIE